MDSIYFSPLPRPLQALYGETVQSPLHVVMATMNLQTPFAQGEVVLCLEVEDQEGLAMKCVNAIAGPMELGSRWDVNLSFLEDKLYK